MIVNLDRRIRIERGVQTKDAKGAPVTAWSHFATVWAEWQDALPSRSESVRTGLSVARNQVRVRIRYLTGLDSAMQVVHASTVYNIVGGPAELGRKEWHEMVLERYSSG